MKYITKYGPWVAAALALAVIAYIAVTLRNYRPPSEFTMATGREGGAYYKFGLEYQERLHEQGYTLHLVPTAGSQENLKLLREGKVDVALVQTGTATEEDEETLSSLASLFYEPLWIFYRKDAHSDPIHTIPELAKLDIAVGEEGGGTHDIALFVLEENGITEANAELFALPNTEAARALLDGEIDVVFMIASPEALPVMELLSSPEIELMNIGRVRAYESRYDDITTLTLGEGTVDLARNIPDEDKVLLSAVATFVATSLLSPDLARVLLTVAKKIHGPGGLLEARGEFPSNKLVEIPMDVAAEGYLENGPTGLDRFFPVWIASRLERTLFLLVPFLVLLYPLFRTTPMAVGFFFRFRINRWYRRLRQIELGVDAMSLEEMDEQIIWLDDLDQDLAKRLAVPMMYLADVYLLRFQVNQVNQRLLRRKQQLLANEPSSTHIDAAGSEPPDDGDVAVDGLSAFPKLDQINHPSQEGEATEDVKGLRESGG